ncbi:glycoside hydrolase family 16 protein [Salinimicrobium sp. HB62]|uniref:glycoside hydrolase family 16 protein n=1 Tax=Salinimicrobium sp. HB62 TaxID=3077781 RepID=UPI002D774478|nr:glycoside hydrolase family 16 protein [Salinimicrobium sp. HB62]
MKKLFSPNTLVLLGLGLFVLLSCEASSDEIVETEDIIPSNLSLEVSIVGADEQHPYGDGTGVIKCTASAANAVRYEFHFGNGETVTNTTGATEFTYTKKDLNSYSVSVYAYSSTNDYVSTTKKIQVLVERPPFNDLVFSDEFDTDGSPDNSKWDYDLGTGSNGWGNGEKQYYTDRLENVKVEDGLLKITAKKENYGNSAYTSARILTEGKFDFTYGRVEVKAKLPYGEGTWPAIWMLGSNIRTVGWPNCGEIDIMEHWGHNQGIVQSALHTPSSYGDTTNHGAQQIEDVSTAFHVYEVEWDSQEIIFSVDGEVHYTYSPANKNSETWPFNSDHFLILNVAMGGSWFSIDPNFESSTMEVDYVRVYQ